MTGAPYISWRGHGAVDLAAPGVFTGATMTMFGFDADKTAMQATADRLLNKAAGGAVKYEVVASVAMASFMDVARCTSGTDIVGWLPGRETALWMVLLESHPGDPFKDRLVFWAPYIFISYTIGMVTGREIWGWPKALATITVAGDDPADPVFACETTYFPTLSADTRGVDGTLFKVTSDVPGPAPTTIWRTAAEALEGLLGGFLGGVAELLIDGLRLQPHVPSVALKQFRQAGANDIACYQAICDSPLLVTGFNGGGPLTDPYSLAITTCESHQIIQDFLGRPPAPDVTTLPVTFAGWVGMDFQALTGSDVIVRGG